MRTMDVDPSRRALTMRNMQRGYSMLEVLIAMGVIVAMLAISGSMMVNIFKSSTETLTASYIGQLKKDFVRTFEDERFWENTIRATLNNDASGSQMTCLANDNDCAAARDVGTAIPFVPVRGCPDEACAPNTLTAYLGYNPRDDATAGFDRSGQACVGFNAVNSNPSCPYRFNFTWEPMCPDIATNPVCNQPEVLVRMTFQGPNNAGDFVMRNSSNYSGTFRIAWHIEDAFQQATATCPAGQLLTGILPDGSPECTTTNALGGGFPLNQ